MMRWIERCCFIITELLSGVKILHGKMFFSKPVVRTRVFLTRSTCRFYGSRRNWHLVPCSRSRRRLLRLSVYGLGWKNCLTWSLSKIFFLITRKITRIVFLFSLSGGRRKRIKKCYPPRKKWMPCEFSRYINPKGWNLKRLLFLSVPGILMIPVTGAGYGARTGRRVLGIWSMHHWTIPLNWQIVISGRITSVNTWRLMLTTWICFTWHSRGRNGSCMFCLTRPR